MIDLIVNIKNFLINIFIGIKVSIKLMIKSIISFPDHIKSIKSKIANLEETNLEMADYHLKNGNLNDAILRLKILSRFIVPSAPKAHYKLAWCYFIKKDFDKALENLEKCPDLDQYDLKKHILNDAPEEVPLKLLQEYKNLTPIYQFEKFKNKAARLCIEVIDIMLQHLQNVPKKCQILDLGCNAGDLGLELSTRVAKEYTLTGVEDNGAMLEQAKSTGAYDNIFSLSLEDFLLEAHTKYDIILSLDELSRAKNFHKYLDKIHNIIKVDGFFILVFKVGQISGLNNNKVEFLYTKDDLKRNIIDSRFAIIETKTIELEPLANYLFVVCKPNLNKETQKSCAI